MHRLNEDKNGLTITPALKVCGYICKINNISRMKLYKVLKVKFCRKKG